MVAAELALDLLIAGLCLILLAMLLPNVIELANLALYSLGWPVVEWLSLLDSARDAPFTKGIFVTGMLATTLLPTVLHLCCGMWALLLGLRRDTTKLAQLIPDDGSDFKVPDDKHKIIDAIKRRGFWLLPASVLIVLALGGLYHVVFNLLLHQSAGGFLADLAVCSTVWAHGTCNIDWLTP
jgi:hypothetical protein